MNIVIDQDIEVVRGEFYCIVVTVGAERWDPVKRAVERQSRLAFVHKDSVKTTFRASGALRFARIDEAVDAVREMRRDGRLADKAMPRIRRYKVATTCRVESLGPDVERIIEHIYSE